jgi:hypothetical protein
MRVIRYRTLFLIIFFLAANTGFSEENILIRDEIGSMPYFDGVLEGKTIGQEGSSYIEMKEKEITFFSKKLYPKYYPIYKNYVISSGRWMEEKISSEKNMPRLIQYKLYCGKNVLCLIVESGVFYWIVTLTDSGRFIDALPIYGWQSEKEGSGFKMKNIRKMGLESDIFAKSQQLLPDIEAYSPQTTTKFAFGISDARLLCSHFDETSYVPYEHLVFQQTRVYRLKSDGHFEVVQEGSCVLSNAKIAELGLADFVEKAKDRH